MPGGSRSGKPPPVRRGILWRRSGAPATLPSFMNRFRRWAAGLSQGRLLLMLVVGGAGALWLNTASRSRVWAYDEAITAEAERQEEADLEHRVERAARAEYVRLYRRTVPESTTRELQDTLARLEAGPRQAMTEALGVRRAYLRRMATLLRSGEVLSWMLLALLVYLTWSHAAGRRPTPPSD